jgi:hypothetical protein
MNHLDYHTLEMFVLGSATVRAERQSISGHLSACEDCRRIAGEIAQFYAEAERHASAERHELLAPGAVTRALNLHPEAYPRSVALKPVSSPLGVRVARFCRVHPVAAGSLSLLGIALLIAGVLLPFGVFREANPSYKHYNFQRNVLEVYDRDDRLLWEKPMTDVWALAQREELYKSSQIAIGDLNGDGTNEVAMIAPVTLGSGEIAGNMLMVIDGRGREVVRLRLGGPISFAGRSYDGKAYGGSGLGIVGGPGGKEIVAALCNWRSPSVVVRLDPRGTVLGEYWHYGHLTAMNIVHSPDGTNDRIIMTGINDGQDTSGVRFPVLAVLDPSKIIGKTEASATRGFGLPVSSAEVHYIRVAGCDMDRAIKSLPVIRNKLSSEDDLFRFVVVTTQAMRFVNSADTVSYSFEYDFTPGWSVSDVRANDMTELSHARLRAAGLVTSTFGPAYCAALRDSVLYWTGDAWRRPIATIHGRDREVRLP